MTNHINKSTATARHRRDLDPTSTVEAIPRRRGLTRQDASISAAAAALTEVIDGTFPLDYATTAVLGGIGGQEVVAA